MNKEWVIGHKITWDIWMRLNAHTDFNTTVDTAQALRIPVEAAAVETLSDTVRSAIAQKLRPT